MHLTEISPAELTGNVFDRISRQWMLVAAGDEEKFNFLTASWGQLGMLWFQPTANIYLRQSRYTKEFVDREERFTLTFLREGNREALTAAGSLSGRDHPDQAAACGLTPCFVDGCPTFEQADVVLICRKLYVQQLDPQKLLDEQARRRAYDADPEEHTMYIAQIERIYVNQP